MHHLSSSDKILTQIPARCLLHSVCLDRGPFCIRNSRIFRKRRDLNEKTEFRALCDKIQKFKPVFATLFHKYCWLQFLFRLQIRILIEGSSFIAFIEWYTWKLCTVKFFDSNDQMILAIQTCITSSPLIGLSPF